MKLGEKLWVIPPASCGNACAGAQVCAASDCDVSCRAGDTRCAPSGCAALDSDPRSFGGCGLACPARAFAVSACRAPGAGMDAGLPFPDAGPSGAACGWICQSVDCDLNAGPLAASDGCECHKLGDIDLPDLNHLDANCEGIVGDKAHAIFVSPLGKAGNPGAMAVPVKTLAEAIALALQLSGSITGCSVSGMRAGRSPRAADQGNDDRACQEQEEAGLHVGLLQRNPAPTVC